jgi:mediator of RNA polymerase II transcription subunit 8, fungi type
LQSLLDVIQENHALFQRVGVHPSTNYPGRTHEYILLQLLRKKLEPDVEEWFESGREAAWMATPKGIEQLEEVWEQLRVWCDQRVKRYVLEEAGGTYTAEEREIGVENIRTGLMKNLDEDSEEDDDDEDEDEEEVLLAKQQQRATTAATAQNATGPAPEVLFWFAARGDGELPPSVDLEYLRGQIPGTMGMNPQRRGK